MNHTLIQGAEAEFAPSFAIWAILAICQSISTSSQFMSILKFWEVWQFLQFVNFDNFRRTGGVRRNNISNFLRGHSLQRIFRLV